MKNIIKNTILVFAISIFVASCHDDLNQSPIDPDSLTEEDVFANVDETKSALAKLYSSLALTGQNGPAGDPDLDPNDIDEGFSQFSRMLFNLNEITTDHALTAWAGDAGLQDLHGLYWAGSNQFSQAMYYRLGQEVSFCNSFIAQASNLDYSEIPSFIAEARFLRAYSYYNLMDLFGGVPILTEVSTDLPIQNSRAEVFDFVETELLEIADILPASNEYGRVDQVAAWALLSRLYLNAEVWTGIARYNDCVTYSENVINSSYSIHMNDANGNGTAYDELFLADNDSNGAQNEFIFTLNFDGLFSKSWGGSTFLIRGAIGGTMDPTDFGFNGGWAGHRTTKALVEKFPEPTLDIDALNSSLGGTLSTWGLVGDATENSWDGPDQKMYETASNQYSLYVELSSGLFKFRLNDDPTWAVNYGDNGADGTLELGGGNITVEEGVYLITMDLDNLTYSLTEIIPSIDRRGMFHSDGQSLEIESLTSFINGYGVTKFKNVDSNGDTGSDTSGEMSDTDLPLIRLAEIYLNYAEATLRGGAGNTSLAVDNINELRERAYGDTSGNISSSDLTLDFIIDERSRELYWEGQRRTDLVRYNYFTSGLYVWPWKGNVPGGTSVDSFRNIYPLPTNLLTVNPNLTQNEGY